jgi:hypothetical protein
MGSLGRTMKRRNKTTSTEDHIEIRAALVRAAGVEAGTVKVKNILLVDGAGKTRASLSGESESPHLTFFAPTGKPALLIGLEQDSPVIGLVDPNTGRRARADHQLQSAVRHQHSARHAQRDENLAPAGASRGAGARQASVAQ